jgi:phosphoglycolate phosphatase
LGIVPDLFIFDLDGTLFDSHEQIIRAANATRAANLLHLIYQRDAVGLVGLSADKLFPQEYGGAPVALDPLVSEFRLRLADEIQVRNQLFEGAESFVKLIKSNGAFAGVATSKPTWLARIVVANSPLSRCVDWIQGTDNFPPKPNPEVILRCIRALDPAQNIYMVGDHVVDMLAAKSAGVTGLGISQGSHSSEVLILSGAKYVGRNFNELSETLLVNNVLKYKENSQID